MLQCPRCHKVGEAVSVVTVSHLVVADLSEIAPDAKYALCTSEDCDVVYFSGEAVSFLKGQLRVPVWFKRDANPRYICYCNKVTVEQVVDAVKNKGAKTLGDLVKLTGVMRNGDCERQNPTGKCCSTAIMQVVKDSLEA